MRMLHRAKDVAALEAAETTQAFARTMHARRCGPRAANRCGGPVVQLCVVHSGICSHRAVRGRASQPHDRRELHPLSFEQMNWPRATRLISIGGVSFAAGDRREPIRAFARSRLTRA